MCAAWTPPGKVKKLAIEWKARQFCDPIQKLAYLQRAARKGTSIRWSRFSFYAVPVSLVLLLGAAGVPTATDVPASLPGEKPVSGAKTAESKSPPASPDSIWLVEAGSGHETYSNGLRIENQFLSPNMQRAYVIFRNGLPRGFYENPAGIVFHTSESIQAPFSSEQNAYLVRIGRELLEYVRRHQAYHFVIDRFGRVFRIVPETDSANHAGYSVWADKNGVYVNLNHCFLGVSFEAQTREIEHGNYLSQSQIHSGRQLVEMLVSKYHIPLENCVTHAQVSVDPKTMTIGYHYDGAGDFPFQQLGIPDNYGLPIPSLFVFGFDFDSRFLMYSGARMWSGMRSSEQRLRQDAESHQRSLDQYKQALRKNYWAAIETLKNLGIIKEN